jgi:hypothetical protein
MRRTSFALLAAFTFYAICGTRDYLEWQRIRWTALHELIDDRHIDAGEIDGGFEFNALHFYDPHQVPDFTNPGRSWWWVHGNTYLIGLGPVPGYAVVKEYSYRSWLSPHAQKVIVLRKE